MSTQHRRSDELGGDQVPNPGLHISESLARYSNPGSQLFLPNGGIVLSVSWHWMLPCCFPLHSACFSCPPKDPSSFLWVEWRNQGTCLFSCVASCEWMCFSNLPLLFFNSSFISGNLAFKYLQITSVCTLWVLYFIQGYFIFNPNVLFLSAPDISHFICKHFLSFPSLGIHSGISFQVFNWNFSHVSVFSWSNCELQKDVIWVLSEVPYSSNRSFNLILFSQCLIF